MLKNMKIGYRLFWLVVVMSAAIIIVSLSGMLGIRNGIKGLEEVFEGGIDSIYALNRLAYIYCVDIVTTINQVQAGTLGLEDARQKIAQARQDISHKWLEYQETAATPENRIQATKLRGYMDSLAPILLQLEMILTEKDKEKFDSFTVKEVFPAVDPLVAQLYRLIESHADSTIEEYKNARSTVYTNYEITAITTILGILLTIIIAYLIVNSITKPLAVAVHAANRLALGDASVQIPVTSQDEVGQLLQAMQSMVGKLRHVISGIQDEVSVLSNSTHEIVKSVSEASESTSETAAAVTETTTTVEELKQTAHISAEKAQDVLNAAENAHNVVKTSEASLQATIQDMNEIEDKMRVISDSIVELSKHSLAIGEIIDTVNDLAEQSNLLAVNAAIEAAKAGEQGKSFGVVAQEIRLLAEQSKNATVQVRAILDDIRNDTSAAVMATEQGSKAVTKGVSQSMQTTQSINSLSSSIARVTKSAKQIDISSQQQLVGVDQVTDAMSNINSASAEHVEHMKQIETAIIALNDVGRKLKEVADEYTL